MVSSILYLIGLTIYYFKPNLALTEGVYSYTYLLFVIMNFMSQALLVVIFWQLASVQEESDEEPENSVVVQDFDEEAQI